MKRRYLSTIETNKGIGKSMIDITYPQISVKANNQIDFNHLYILIWVPYISSPSKQCRHMKGNKSKKQVRHIKILYNDCFLNHLKKLFYEKKKKFKQFIEIIHSKNHWKEVMLKSFFISIKHIPFVWNTHVKKN